MFIKPRRAQSILEYAILIAIVIGAIVIMQVYVKRGISGRIKDSSDRISGGQSFAAGQTTTKESSSLTGTRVINESTAIDSNASTLAGSFAGDAEATNVVDSHAYSASKTTGGSTTSNSASKSSGLKDEVFNQNQLTSNVADDLSGDLFGKVAK